jgi:hypothetical protein
LGVWGGGVRGGVGFWIGLMVLMQGFLVFRRVRRC